MGPGAKKKTHTHTHPVAQHMVTNKKVAVKIINKLRIKNLDMMDKVRREIHILRMCSHPHIIRLYQVIDTPSDIFVVMVSRCAVSRGGAGGSEPSVVLWPQGGGLM